MNEIHCGDCLELMRGMPDNSVDLILTDPPYYRVKGDWWDRQWDTRAGFLAWLDTVLEQFHRVLKPNGSLYMFASPRMSAHVEVLIGERFNVLNHIVWTKEDAPTHALKYGDDRFRQYVQKSERIIFAEHYGADNIAKGEAGYEAKCDELRGFVFEPLRAYLDGEKDRAGFTTRQVAEAFQQRTGSRTVTGMAGHWFTSIQWTLPTEDCYNWLQELFNAQGGEYLRREYEYLRRPFAVTADVPYTDTWTFPTVQAYKGKHVCEKPMAMLEHIITASSKPGAVVLDAFAGSGATLEAAKNLGREYVGIEIDQQWADKARHRCTQRGLFSSNDDHAE